MKNKLFVPHLASGRGAYHSNSNSKTVVNWKLTYSTDSGVLTEGEPGPYREQVAGTLTAMPGLSLQYPKDHQPQALVPGDQVAG